MVKVSVCMVTYNHEKYIREAIEGVLSQQTDFEVELLIGNDCSKDGTDSVINDIIKTHPKAHQVKYFNHPKNKGMMPNFAFLLGECKGGYIALCDGDDYWTDPLKLQKQTDFLESNPDYALCFHKVAVLKKDGALVPDFITGLPENHETFGTLLRHGNYIHTPSVLFRNVVTSLPYEFYDSPIGDFFIYVLVAQHGKLKYMPEAMCVYRHDVGFLSEQKGMEITTNVIRFYSCLLSYLQDEDAKKIIFARQQATLQDFSKNAENKFTSNQYLARKKSFPAIFKIIAAKILGRK